MGVMWFCLPFEPRAFLLVQSICFFFRCRIHRVFHVHQQFDPVLAVETRSHERSHRRSHERSHAPSHKLLPHKHTLVSRRSLVRTPPCPSPAPTPASFPADSSTDAHQRFQERFRQTPLRTLPTHAPTNDPPHARTLAPTSAPASRRADSSTKVPHRTLPRSLPRTLPYTPPSLSDKDALVCPLGPLCEHLHVHRQVHSHVFPQTDAHQRFQERSDTNAFANAPTHAPTHDPTKRSHDRCHERSREPSRRLVHESSPPTLPRPPPPQPQSLHPSRQERFPKRALVRNLQTTIPKPILTKALATDAPNTPHVGPAHVLTFCACVRVRVRFDLRFQRRCIAFPRSSTTSGREPRGHSDVRVAPGSLRTKRTAPLSSFMSSADAPLVMSPRRICQRDTSRARRTLGDAELTVVLPSDYLAFGLSNWLLSVCRNIRASVVLPTRRSQSKSILLWHPNQEFVSDALHADTQLALLLIAAVRVVARSVCHKFKRLQLIQHVLTKQGVGFQTTLARCLAVSSTAHRSSSSRCASVCHKFQEAATHSTCFHQASNRVHLSRCCWTKGKATSSGGHHAHVLLGYCFFHGFWFAMCSSRVLCICSLTFTRGDTCGVDVPPVRTRRGPQRSAITW